MRSARSTHRVAAVLGLLILLGLTVGCGVSGLATARPPRWACPSPTPLPWGPAGPIKAQIALPTPIPAGPQEYEDVYYEEWEQEYPELGPPFPSPTPYALVGTTYLLGQRVEIGNVHLTVNARAGDLVDRPGVPANTQQLYLVALTWINHTAEAIPIDYRERVRLRAVTSPRGATLTDSNWGLTAEARQVAGMPAPPDDIPPGTSDVTLPILGPPGTPQTVEVVFVAVPGVVTAPAPEINGEGGTPTPDILPTATPVLNTELRSTAPQFLTVQWTATRLGIGPACADPGAITDWEAQSWERWGHEAVIGMDAPPGVARIVQLALEQVGKRYVWGAKGPEQFDCSGLVAWLYAQIGLRIPQGTGGQWPGMTPVAANELQPGDLVFFAIGGGRVDHVGMLIGDLNGDGDWDMVHAANPALGVRVDYDVLRSPSYATRIVGFRTAR
jgi:cell wall-associated NlpC family hydrolase